MRAASPTAVVAEIRRTAVCSVSAQSEAGPCAAALTAKKAANIVRQDATIFFPANILIFAIFIR